MVTAISVCLYVLCSLAVSGAFEKGSQLGCFSSTNTGLLHGITGRGADPTPDLTSCITRCTHGNFTFAGFGKTKCLCGQYLGESTRVPIRECLDKCSRPDCYGRERLLVFILRRDTLEIEDGADSNSSSVIDGVSVRQWEMLGGGAVVLVFALSLLIHCVRVSRRRSRLMRLYVSGLERGEEGRVRPPGWVSVSNTLCAEFFCCCCPRDTEEEVDIDYQELLHDLELRLDPKRRKSFTSKVKDYIQHCEKERNMERVEIERILRTLSKGDILSPKRSSLRSLAQQLAMSSTDNSAESRHLPGSLCPVHMTRSSMPRLCRKMEGSSVSSPESCFPQHNSSLSMYANSNLRRGANTSATRRALNHDTNTGPVIPDGTDDAGSVTSQFSQSSRASSRRLLPVSRENLRDEMSQLSRQKQSNASASERRVRRKRSRYDDLDSESFDSER